MHLFNNGRYRKKESQRGVKSNPYEHTQWISMGSVTLSWEWHRAPLLPERYMRSSLYFFKQHFILLVAPAVGSWPQVEVYIGAISDDSFWEAWIDHLRSTVHGGHNACPNCLKKLTLVAAPLFDQLILCTTFRPLAFYAATKQSRRETKLFCTTDH